MYSQDCSTTGTNTPTIATVTEYEDELIARYEALQDYLADMTDEEMRE